ncbi:Phosphatidylserine/phosphatidylglycerophosphate /cardiolipin synthase [Nitrosomonas nitrosa]|uniref:Phosphatidylserine/phosphatidylglycerophosphate /cardiolipin synthase n=1 Tax=Nitrosomonas nitrosa TaxID=52442 RepID=A0A8H8Z0S4_9PROT|nr:VTT domain-containing protein [Nitrosomonas nitrosa]CAE6509607.1 Phosphatidylserine/phosphatidylglycerophosphate /cardiolipin synthase [Nitrosomonas nitrosa]
MKILNPGHNCWRIDTAERVTFLVDGADYFQAFRATAMRAELSLLILAWDTYSNLRLIRSGEEVHPNELRTLLDHIAKAKSKLQCYVLNWDFAMLYGMDREWLPVYQLDWRTHRRVHFWLDDCHPLGASHHQKLVVIDDTVAFCGGLDLTRARWDTPEHKPGDSRRDEGAGPSDPHHDVQLMVGGPIARSLGELARDRWKRASGYQPHVHEPRPLAQLWPNDVPVDAENVRIAIARTDPAYQGRAEIREVERLYLDAIAAARRSIYIENQYISSPAIGDALARRLEEPDGPDVVIVSGKCTRGWLSQMTMDVLRARLGHKLQQSDREGRFRLLYPEIPGIGKECVNVHSKIMIVDDVFVRVGSANLNNRSMGLDSECDLAFESEDRKDLCNAISYFRARLLAEHLGAEPRQVTEAIESTGSLVKAIDHLSQNERTLKPLPMDIPKELEELVSEATLLDPEKPIDPDRLAEQLVHQEDRPPARRRLILWVAMLLVLAALTAMWRWTPLSEYLDIDRLLVAIDTFNQLPAAPLLAVGGILVAGLAMFPITVLIIVTVLTFGPFTGFTCAFLGALGCALSGYGLGAFVGRNTVRHIAGNRLNRISKRLAKQGLLAVILIRVIPVAPFTVVNLVAGASHIRFRDFVLGTAIGMGPGIAATTLFTDRIRAMLEEPSWGNGILLALIFGGIALAGYGLITWLKRRANDTPSTNQD